MKHRAKTIAGQEQLLSGTLQLVYQSLADSHKLGPVLCSRLSSIPLPGDTSPFPLALYPTQQQAWAELLGPL